MWLLHSFKMIISCLVGKSWPTEGTQFDVGENGGFLRKVTEIIESFVVSANQTRRQLRA